MAFEPGTNALAYADSQLVEADMATHLAAKPPTASTAPVAHDAITRLVRLLAGVAARVEFDRAVLPQGGGE